MIVKGNSDFLAHHGIKGQKWGVRRFQNSDGSLTEAGKKRYSVDKKLNKEMISTVLDGEFNNGENRKFLKEELGITSKDDLSSRLYLDDKYNYNNKKTGKKGTSYIYRLNAKDGDESKTDDQRLNIAQTEYIVEYDRGKKKIDGYMFNWI